MLKRDVNKENANGQTPLKKAFKDHNLNRVISLIEKDGADINYRETGMSPLSYLLYYTHTSKDQLFTLEVLDLFSKHPDFNPNAKIAHENSLLSSAHNQDRPEIFDKLMELRANPFLDSNLLEEIIRKNHTRYIDSIYEHSFAIQIESPLVGKTETLLDLAYKHKNMTLFKRFLKSRINPIDVSAQKEISVFHQAVKDKEIDYVRAIFNSGQERNWSLKSKGKSALHLAAQNEDHEMLALLSTFIPDLNLTDHFNRTAIDILEDKKEALTKIQDTLISKGAEFKRDHSSNGINGGFVQKPKKI